MLVHINEINIEPLPFHLTLCPFCHRVDVIENLYLIQGGLFRNKFSNLLDEFLLGASCCYDYIREVLSGERFGIDVCDINLLLDNNELDNMEDNHE